MTKASEAEIKAARKDAEEFYADQRGHLSDFYLEGLIRAHMRNALKTDDDDRV